VRVAEEARLLRDADASLRAGDTAGATRWLDEHARLFPHGVLAEERDVQRVFVLCAAGQTDAARAEAGRFLVSYPQSLLAGRVRTSCAGQ
jgi:outer membrane protein assembly factor BamD (BamD/ComL family)